MNNIYINFNNKTNYDLDLILTKRPVIPFANMEYEQIDIDGRNGSYYVEKGLQDVSIPIEFNFFVDDADDIRNKIREIREWFTNIKDSKLFFNYDSNYFYRVKTVTLDDCTYENLYEIQTFTANFVVSPFQYSFEGLKEITLADKFYNFWDDSTPVYRIEGNGNCNFIVNGVSIQCSINKSITIDTENDKILENDGSLSVGKTNIKNMKDLLLVNGENTFSCTSGFTAYITPNYRKTL